MRIQAGETANAGRSHSPVEMLVYPPALVLSLAGLLASFIAYYPGAMTWDSFVMWGMGWEWPWHDWHTPYIALLMGLSRRLVGDPSVLLFLQLLLSWGGLYLSACGLRGRSAIGAALLPLLGLTPMFLMVSGYLHKTPLQASVFLFVFGALYLHHQWGRRLSVGWTLFLILLLLLGIPVRIYGLVCGLPLSMYLFYCRAGRRGARAAAGYLLAAAALAGASLVVHHFVVYDVLKALKLHKVQTLYRYDLAAVYALTGDDAAPRMLRKRYASHASMRELYERENGMWRISYAYQGGIPPGYLVAKDVPERLLTEEELAYYRQAWLGTLRRHPGTWLEHKVHGFAVALGLGVEMEGFRKASLYRSRQNIYGLQKRGGVFYRSLNRYMKRTRGSLLLKPWLWMALTAILLVPTALLCRSKPQYRDPLAPVLVLLVSAILFYPQLFLTALDNDLRFSYWAIVSCALALYLFLATVLAAVPGSSRRERAARGGGGGVGTRSGGLKPS